MFNKVYQTKKVYKKRADGKLQYWQGFVYEFNGNYYTSVIFKQGKNGIEQESELKNIKGSNIGKANSLDPYNQAISEIESRYRKKLDKGYVDVGKDLPNKVMPMLAKKFDYNKIKYPSLVQPKLDGCRAIYLPEKQILISRKNKSFKTVNHIIQELKNVNLILDGELILPSEFSFQETISALKKENKNSEKLEFHVYDLVEDKPFNERYNLIRDLFCSQTNKETDNFFISNNVFKDIKLVKGYQVNNFNEIMGYHSLFKDEGFEGTIIRDLSAYYEQDKRSNGLLKLKDVLSDEFKIVDIQYDNRNAVYFVCNKNHVDALNPIFEVCPVGSLKDRKSQDYRSYIGKWATINYYDLTNDYAPKFANLIAIRDYE